jgi:hypothetical protein
MTQSDTTFYDNDSCSLDSLMIGDMLFRGLKGAPYPAVEDEESSSLPASSCIIRPKP